MKEKAGWVVGFIEYKNGEPYHRASMSASKKKNLAIEYLYSVAQRFIDGGHVLVEDYGDGCKLSGTGGYEIEFEIYPCAILEN